MYGARWNPTKPHPTHLPTRRVRVRMCVPNSNQRVRGNAKTTSHIIIFKTHHALRPTVDVIRFHFISLQFHSRANTPVCVGRGVSIQQAAIVDGPKTDQSSSSFIFSFLDQMQNDKSNKKWRLPFNTDTAIEGAKWKKKMNGLQITS